LGAKICYTVQAGMRTETWDFAQKRTDKPMTRLEELVVAVNALSEKDYGEFRRWFLERDWANWDRQIEADSAAGRLDFLHSEAQEAQAKGTRRSF